MLAIRFARKILTVGTVFRALGSFVRAVVLLVAALLGRYLLAAIPVVIIVVPVGLLVTWIPVWLGMSPRGAENVALFGVVLLLFIFFVLPFIVVWHKRRHVGPVSHPVRLYDAWGRLFPPPWRGRTR